MIGLVDILPPPSSGMAGTLRLECLPDPPAVRLSGMIVRCRDRQQVGRTLDWYGLVRSRRPEFPLSLVCTSDACAEPLSRCRFPIIAVVSPGELCAGGISNAVLNKVRAAAVEGRIIEELVNRHGSAILEARSTLTAAVAHAVRGGTVQGVGRELGVTRDTVRRRLNAVGVSAGVLMAWARLRAFEFRVELGYDRAAALIASGWMSPDARRKAAARAGRTAAM